MDLRRCLLSAALAVALSPVVLSAAALVSPSTARAASSFPASSPVSWPAYCAGPPPAVVPPLDHGTLLNPDDHSGLTLSTPGLPHDTDAGTPVASGITAGSGWHDFQLTASLQGMSNSDLADSPHELKWTVFVSNSPQAGHPANLPASDVQYLDGGTWSDLGPWAGANTKLVTTPFEIGNGAQPATATVRLRFKVGAGAPHGPAYVVEFGTYVDAEQACTHFTFAVNMITVGAPGSAARGPGTLRYVGIGIVVAAGAAVVLVARRRKRP